MVSRDLVMIGIGVGIGFLIFTTLGKRMVLAGMGMGKAEVERVLSKAEYSAKERAAWKPKE